MAVETAADRAIFVSTEDFGATVAWRGATVAAIFDGDYQLIATTMLEEGMEGADPRILLPSSAVPAGAAHGDIITVSTDILSGGSAAFAVVEIKPDGTGMTEVRLMEE